MKRSFTRVIGLITLTATLVAATGCGSETPKAASASEPREITVAVAPGFFPITYADDNGNAAGYDVEVFKALDELLTQYTFKYEIADKETLNVGVQAGTYQAGINSLFKTEERVETYYVPENNMGYTAVGIVQRADDNIDSLTVAHDDNRKIYDINSAGGIRFVIENWNKANPDKAIDYNLTTSFSYAELFASIRAGDYDYTVDLIPVFNLQKPEVVDGLKITDPIDVVPTYTIINKSETEFGDAVNAGLATLKENGTLSKLSVEAFGYDVFEIAGK